MIFMENKKIKNSTACNIGNINFKSKLEKMAYTELSLLGLNPQYEPTTFVIWDGFNPITPFYDEETKSQYLKRKVNDKTPRKLILKNTKIQPIHYTPDLYFKYKNIDIWLEIKGFENDLFYVKKKMFRKYLDDLYTSTGQKSMYFEIYTKYQLLQAIEIIKEYAKEEFI